MIRAATDLPDDVEMLRAIIAAQARQLAGHAERLQLRDTLIEKLKAQLAVPRRARFGASSEKIERTIAQLELALEDIEAAVAETVPPILSTREDSSKTKPARQPLPDHLPRHEVVHEAGDCACPCCGGRDFLKAGAAVSEMLDYVPAAFRVLRHVQHRLVCKAATPRSPRRCPRRRSSGASPRLTCRSIASPRSTPARVSTWPAPPWPTGPARPAHC